MFKLEPLKGNEGLSLDGKKLSEGIIQEFWGWSYSAIHNPLIRGSFAEFLVYKSLKETKDFNTYEEHFKTKIEGDVHDLKFEAAGKNHTIQVKSIDSFKKKPVFEFPKIEGFDPIANKNISEKDRWSDYYIFCYLTLNNSACDRLKELHVQWNENNNIKTDDEISEYEEKQEEVRSSLLELNNWCFYIVPCESLPNQNSMVLRKFEDLVRDHKAYKCKYPEIGEALRRHIITQPPV